MRPVQNSADVTSAALACAATLSDLPEDEQIAILIKTFNLPPVVNTQTAIWVTGDTRTDFYARQSVTDAKFDKNYPQPIGGRRSERASRRYWTIDLLRWLVRLAVSGSR